MLKFTTGNLLDADVDALVNTVNEVGVMGKGMALQFREAFPESAREYMARAKAGGVTVGKVLVTESGRSSGARLIVHFPTKKHWRHPSRLGWIEAGLLDLKTAIREHSIRSVAIPPLGCGNGGLDWASVRRLIEQTMSDLDGVDVLVFEPTTLYHAAPKRTGAMELTPARGLVAELVRRYEMMGMGCSILEVQKLAYFLERSVDRLRLSNMLELRFVASRFGPYSDRLRHLLDGLDGSYLRCERRLADARPSDLIQFDHSLREPLAVFLSGEETQRLVPALDDATRLIDGFESAFGMELLATVDWLLRTQGAIPSVEYLQAAIAAWPSSKSAARRKQRLFDERVLGIALERIRPYLSRVAA
jgi:O-acetyl-ADP-ribose deacetylase (regulator of RNase III)